ncbi:PhzF family phenazine biosynthesis protein [Erythrobacteraceae bacterium CFH 75059]|uniref:PhzF family phenazine biosynthesis protein n=1 Tax=Qipengyuania thermophila TaxID=2509361 RepID=UPI00101E9ECE|nr:PhzF family phenazine biosynthesis protein [Qipengyuania thermophila]TCD06734.1 PhzF family phenazine biosynthesis protein [Erythrobacteraceae bacterium CFH 75059]
MTRSVAYWHVDAFASAAFGGNQAAVMVLDRWPDDALLQAIGAENNFAETAFLVRDTGGEADWELRWFTPTHEVALCGHATLASGHVLLGRNGGDRVRFRTRQSGVLEVRREPGGYTLDLPLTRVAPRNDARLLAALGAQGEVHHSVSGAEQTAIVLLPDAAAVRALAPDMAALAATGVMAICTAPGQGVHDVISRVFVPAWGVDEDSVTGSAHAALTPFWAERLGRARFTAHQASRRGGELTCRLEGERAWIGGACVTVVEGRFYLAG